MIRLLATALSTLLTAAALQAPAAAEPVTTTAATTLTADFSVADGPGYAEVFGSGINVPALTDTAKIDTLHQAGTRFIRGDAYLQHILPDTTIAGYLAGIGKAGSVADPTTWNWDNYAWVDEHHKRGTKTVLIMSYSIDWLGYTPGDGNDYSPPRGADGFRVYEDVIAKIYQRFRGKVDLIEIWNEPDLHGFLNVTNSPWPLTDAGRLEAYAKIYAHAHKAIRSVDPDIPIGGPVSSGSGPGLSWVDRLLPRPELQGKFDFLSYHEYALYQEGRTESVDRFRQRAAALGYPNMPVYVTEWNYSAAYTEVPMNASDARNLSYSALRLTNLYNQHANGANVFADNDESIVPSFYGVHRNGLLPPRARAYQLLSRDLGLGDGVSTIRRTSTPPNLFTGFGAVTTAGGDNVAWVVNDAAQPLEVDVQLKGLGGNTVANLFEASPNQNPVTPKSSLPLQVTNGAATVHLSVPPYSVSGIRLGGVALGNNLAPLATASGSSVSQEHPMLAAANVADGIVGVHATGEWASNQELKPSLTLTWPSPQTVGRVVLFDRANPVDRIRSGTLVFSDGSRVPVPELPNSGLAKDLTFAPRSTTSVRLEIADGAGSNVGLAEIQVYDGADVARAGTITASTGPAYAAIDSRPGSAWTPTDPNPWIRIDWVNDHQLDRIALTGTGAGTLTFSDGTALAVDDLTPTRQLTFPPKNVTWVKFTATGTGASLTQFRTLATPNLASTATVTASSTYQNDPVYAAPAATDGVVNQWFAGEWASDREPNPKLTLTWPTPQRVSQVVLYDRNNLEDHTRGGTLTFSDGSKVTVTGMPNEGTGKLITFPPRTTHSILFESTGTALNAGLSELQARP
ncbi:hypothetical protein HPO96_00420 [Kribbella sandramycini]|uniref:F5/8 type C domain-containing protein n=1 Tax=Kribbella sandramycini TaxID=60450 RepID=A0A7Y4KU10_9ACTN|nr:hypothetical protein [Kribbella sandramycini]MBB6568717.1 hypothetical protein [Kribbella sandramycini]NOL38700.1 hypothetical protein [Kribbella sandramycini]